MKKFQSLRKLVESKAEFRAAGQIVARQGMNTISEETVLIDGGLEAGEKLQNVRMSNTFEKLNRPATFDGEGRLAEKDGDRLGSFVHAVVQLPARVLVQWNRCSARGGEIISHRDRQSARRSEVKTEH